MTTTLTTTTTGCGKLIREWYDDTREIGDQLRVAYCGQARPDPAGGPTELEFCDECWLAELRNIPVAK